MTLDQFFEKLPRDGWNIDVCSVLRRNHPTARGVRDCPLTAACGGSDLRVSDWYIAGRRLGLDVGDAAAIANAADGRQGTLRARLLEHCGLKEPQ